MVPFGFHAQQAPAVSFAPAARRRPGGGCAPAGHHAPPLRKRNAAPPLRLLQEFARDPATAGARPFGARFHEQYTLRLTPKRGLTCLGGFESGGQRVKK